MLQQTLYYFISTLVFNDLFSLYYRKSLMLDIYILNFSDHNKIIENIIKILCFQNY